MTKKLLIHCGIAELQIALLSDGALERYWSETLLGDEEGGAHTGVSRVGDIVLARVKRVVPAINAAFVDIGAERDGFLSARDAVQRKEGPREEAMTISQLVHEGEAVLVQVLRDAIGDKGARVGTNVTLAGRFLVYSPGGGRVLLSRRIEDEAARARLKSILEEIVASKTGAGFVVRTAAIGAGEDELREDVEYLTAIWEEIAAAQVEDEPVVTLHHELGAIERILRDEVGPDIEQVIIDDRQAHKVARSYAEEAMPGFAERIILREAPSPLLAEFGVEDEISALQLSKLDLPNGGWITIEPTEALTAIDVNSGRHVARSDLDATALAVNVQAAEMIGRQLVLRSIGGMIVVDFIPMSKDAALEKVRDILAEQLKRGGAVAELVSMPGMNIVAVTIKRMRKSVGSTVSELCGVCDGHGRRRSIAVIAMDALRQVESAAAAAPGTPIAMRVGAEVAAWLEDRAGPLRAELTRRGITALRVFPESERVRDSFSVETTAVEPSN